MSVCPFAKWRPLSENTSQSRIDPDQIILHSAVDAPGPTSLYGYFERADVTVEAHFFIKWDGTIEQYLNTNVRADANRYANPRAVSIETEDDGDPNQRPWSDAQVASIIRLIEWLLAEHPKIARRQCPAWDQSGIGWHSMWGAPSQWTPAAGKTCPGTVRIVQARQIIEHIASGGKVDVVTDEDIKAIVAHVTDAVLRALRGEGVSGAADATHSNVDDAVIVRIDALEQKIDQALAAHGSGGGLSGEATITLTVT